MDDSTRIVVADVVLGLSAVSLLVAVSIVVTALIGVYVAPRTGLDPAQALSSERTHDLAWPNYQRKQAAMDLAAFATRVRSLLSQGFTGGWGRMSLRPVTWPVLMLASVLALLVVTVFAAVHYAVCLVADLLFLVAVLVVRTADAFYARAKGADASCPSCYGVMDRPAYRCTGCGELHRDIRAGRRGSLFRACVCGARLPTGVLRAAWALESVCQLCRAPLHRGAAVLQDVRVPVFGEPHAGKTRLIFAGLHGLLERARVHGVEITFPDDASRDRAESGLELITRDHRTIKTDWQLAPALTCQIGSGTKGALLHAFDAAGERFRGSGGHDDLRYLEDAHTLLFVVDPFAVPHIREQVASRPRTDLIDEHLGSDRRNPEEAYGEVISRVRGGGIDTTKQRLAVVVSKADVLATLGIPVPTEDSTIKDWLYEAGLHNVVLAAGREFKEVRYFAVASINWSQRPSDYDASAPFVWALDSRGFTALTTADADTVGANS